MNLLIIKTLYLGSTKHLQDVTTQKLLNISSICFILNFLNRDILFFK